MWRPGTAADPADDALWAVEPEITGLTGAPARIQKHARPSSRQTPGGSHGNTLRLNDTHLRGNGAHGDSATAAASAEGRLAHESNRWVPQRSRYRRDHAEPVGIRCRGSIDLSGVPQRSDLPVHSDVSSSLALPSIRNELQLSCQPLSEDTPEIDTGPVIVDIETASAHSYCGVAAVQTVRSTPKSRIKAVWSRFSAEIPFNESQERAMPRRPASTTLPRRPTSMTLTCVAAALAALATFTAAVDSAQARGAYSGRSTVTKGPVVSNPPAGHYGGPIPTKCGKSGICPGPTPHGSVKPSNCQANGAGCTKQY
jgi:hypothetical protein